MKDRCAALDRHDAAGGEALAVADAVHLVDDRHLGIARQQEIGVHRVRRPAVDRARGGNQGLPDHLAVASAEDRAVRGADLRRAVAGLRHDDRLIVVLYFYLDLPLEEVAAVAGMSVSATRARLYRSIQRLRPGVDIEEALK